MRRNRSKAAARYRTAVLLLLAGCLLPSIFLRGWMEVPSHVETILSETLEGEKDPARIGLVYTACALTGRVGYFWGGKSHVLGWDSAWGWPKRVSSPGSSTTDRIRRYGLDCSGFVSWAVATAQEDRAAYDRVGEGVRMQYSLCMPTETPRPGDLAFFPDLSHVGIVLGKDREGVIWVVHCSASLGGVVMTPSTVGFVFYGIPNMFFGETEADFPIDK